MKEKMLQVFDRLLEYSFYGLVFSVPISKGAAESFAGFMLLFFILKKSVRPDFSFLKDRANIFLLLFVLFCGLSLLNSHEYLEKGIKALSLKWLKYIGIFLFSQDILRDRRRVMNAAVIFLATSGLVTLDGILQLFLGKDLIRGKELVSLVNGVPAITGPFNHYNDFGTYLIVVLILLIGMLGAGSLNNSVRAGLVLLGLLSLASIFLTFSRGSWLGFILALLLMLSLSKKAVKILFPLITVLILLLFMLPAVKERFAFTFHGDGDADRFIIWSGAWQMIKENPFLGKGIGTFMDLFRKYMPPSTFIQYAHNCFLQIWAETGIFSLLSFLSFVGTVLYRGVKKFRRSGDPVLLGLVCALSGFLVHSFFDTQLYSLQMAFLFWSLLGITASLTRLELSVNK